MIKHSQTLSYEARGRIFYLLLTISLASLVVYIYAVNMTVHNTVARQSLESQVSTLTTRLSNLEFADIALKNNVSLDMATAHGFAEVTAPVFITRSEGKALTMNTKF